MSTERRFRLGFVTSSDERDLTADDRSAIGPFQAIGIDPEPLIWTDHKTAYDRFDAFLVRSVWDYHLRYPEFLTWLDTIDARGVPVWNEPDTMRWNSNKLYLLELRDGGVNIPLTHAITQPNQHIPDEFLNRPVVLKPAVSADSFRTVRVDSLQNIDIQSSLRHILSHSPAIVQEFMPEIASEGEYSFIFIDGAFSHAVLKRPADGDFRVQEELGGTVAAITPSPGLLEQAQAVMRLLDPMPLYARVDGVRRGTTLVVMELELIEPSLYLLQSRHASDHFARACRKRLDDHA